jgi:hypothetical protein
MPRVIITTACSEKRADALAAELADKGFVIHKRDVDISLTPNARSKFVLTFLTPNKQKVKTWLSQSNYAATVAAS